MRVRTTCAPTGSKEALRAIFDPDLIPGEAARLLDRFVSWAQRSRPASFVKLQRTIRKYRDGILAALELGINNGPHRRSQPQGCAR